VDRSAKPVFLPKATHSRDAPTQLSKHSDYEHSALWSEVLGSELIFGYCILLVEKFTSSDSN
jgi:hypothetical protein